MSVPIEITRCLLLWVLATSSAIGLPQSVVMTFLNMVGSSDRGLRHVGYTFAEPALCDFAHTLVEHGAHANRYVPVHVCISGASLRR